MKRIMSGTGEYFLFSSYPMLSHEAPGIAQNVHGS